jgi:hypothetical protein
MARQVRPGDNRKGRGHQGTHTDDQHAAGGRLGGGPDLGTGKELHETDQPLGALMDHQSPAGHGKHAEGHKGQAEKAARDRKPKIL